MKKIKQPPAFRGPAEAQASIEGMAKRGAKVRLLRDNVVIHEGDLSSLQRFKDEVKEVKEGSECGLALATYQDIQVGDVIECFETEEIARTI